MSEDLHSISHLDRFEFGNIIVCIGFEDMADSKSKWAQAMQDGFGKPCHNLNKEKKKEIRLETTLTVWDR